MTEQHVVDLHRDAVVGEFAMRRCLSRSRTKHGGEEGDSGGEHREGSVVDEVVDRRRFVVVVIENAN